MPQLPVADGAALLVVFALWQGFALLIDHSRWSKDSLTASVNALRLGWMMRVVERENRITDSALIANLMHSVSFFASTTVIILGGIAALMGGAGRSYDSFEGIPFLPSVSKELFELKLTVLLLIFIYSFLKFTWSLRQFNYCCILIGGAPPADVPADEKAQFAHRAARVNVLGARSFNEGLRGYYFALAGLGWFVHPVAFVAAAAAVVLILWRREFHSRTRRALRAN